MPVIHETRETRFVEAFADIADQVHATAVEKGWWDKDRNDGEALMLVVSELAEGLEALRRGNPPSDHIPDFSGIEEELADVVIRIMDLSMARGWNVAEAILAKARFNETRPHKHGGKAF